MADREGGIRLCPQYNRAVFRNAEFPRRLPGKISTLPFARNIPGWNSRRPPDDFRFAETSARDRRIAPHRLPARRWFLAGLRVNLRRPVRDRRFPPARPTRD